MNTSIILFIGVVNSTFSCLTWELKEKSLSLICRIQNQFGPVSFIDSKGNIKATCTLNNPSKCETFQINGKAIANTYKNEVVFMINDYERKQFLNDEWTCSQGNRSMKTEVSTSRGKIFFIIFNYAQNEKTCLQILKKYIVFFIRKVIGM